ncbi:hypothetical protein Q427_00505 [Halomonas sp. BC04]|nr:hypothetical protein Q427_00505 [Halomonas sp. BC04]
MLSFCTGSLHKGWHKQVAATVMATGYIQTFFAVAMWHKKTRRPVAGVQRLAVGEEGHTSL